MKKFTPFFSIFFIVCFMVLTALPALSCYENCGEADGGGDFWVSEGENQAVVPSTYSPNGNRTDFNANQWITGGGINYGSFTGFADAYKAQFLGWQIENPNGIHFGTSFMEAGGKFGVTPDCPEAYFDLVTFANGQTNTDGVQNGNSLSMHSDTSAKAGGYYWGTGDPLKAGFNIDFELGSYQELGDLDDLNKGPAGWQYDRVRIKIKSGKIPDSN